MNLAGFKFAQLVTIIAVATIYSTKSQAQSITPASDGTETKININSNIYNITGGKLSGDGGNLFHSFSQFGLKQNEVANFISHPSIQNILTRVVGGDASIINGLIQVTGGNSNFFLMNPGGVIFGTSVSLNVPNDFTVTTANGIGFGSGDGFRFKDIGSNNYSALVGNPTNFLFSTPQWGTITNAGNLTGAQGQNLTLLGGTVISSGKLSVPGGQVTVASIPENNLVRLSQQGSLLSLELKPISKTQHSGDNNFPTISLPPLLTGGDINNATKIIANADGTFNLQGGGNLQSSGDRYTTGDVVIKEIIAKTATLSAANNLKLPESKILTEGDLNLFAQKQVEVRDSQTNPLLIKTGGNLLVKGNQGIDIFALNSPSPFQSGGDLTLMSDGVISTDAHFQTDRNFSIRNLNGDKANFISLYDPIINVGGNYDVGDYLGASIQVTAGGDITYGAININAIDSTIHPTNPAVFLFASGNITGNGEITTSAPENNLLVNIQAGNNLNINQPITTKGGGIILGGRNINTTAATLSTSSNKESGGTIDITSTDGDIQTGLIDASGFGSSVGTEGDAGSISIHANRGNLIVNGDIRGFSVNNFNGTSRNGGGINLRANDGGISIAGNVSTFSSGGNSGNGAPIVISARDNINITGNLSTASQGSINSANAGEVNLFSANGNIFVGDGILAFSESKSGSAGNGQTVNINAANGDVVVKSNSEVGIITNSIATGINSQNAGDITVVGKNISLDNIFANSIVNFPSNASGISGNAGKINIQANNNLTLLNSLQSFSEVTNGNGTTGNRGEINLSAGNLITIGTATNSVINTVGNGNSNLGGDINISSSNLEFSNNFILKNGTGNITFNSTIGNFNGNKNGDLVILNQGQTVFNNPVNIGSLVTDGGGKIILNSSVITTGIQNYMDSVTIGGNNIILQSSNNSIIFNNTLDGLTSGSNSLIIEADNVNLLEKIGSIQPLKDISIKTNQNLTLNNSLTTDGGNVQINAPEITTNQINTNGGNINLNSNRDITVSYINAQSGSNGIGGNVDITAGKFFRATDTFTDKNGIKASISSTGSNSGGSINIRHTGGFVGVPFEIGNSKTNGTLGEITTGLDNRLVIGNSFPFFYSQGNSPNQINLITAFDSTILTPPPNPIPDNPNPTPEIPIVHVDTDITRDVDTTIYTSPKLTPTIELAKAVDVDLEIKRIDNKFSEEFREHLGLSSQSSNIGIQEASRILRKIQVQTGINSAFIYLTFVPTLGKNSIEKDNDHLELIIVTGKNKPIRKVLYNITRARVMETVNHFHRTVTDRTTEDYLEPSQKLYKWFISSLEEDLKKQNINNLLFISDKGLRSVALAALYDGKQFLVEKFSIGLSPSLNLTDTSYSNIKKTKLLAMGASQFKGKNSLPAVPTELSLITQGIWQGHYLLNEQFTIGNFLSQRRQYPFGILHIATHSEFKPGNIGESYIQFWDKKLKLDEIRKLRLNTPPVELMVLSTCSTALGNEQAELGFAGLAAQSGAKTVIASLWDVSDEGTLGLMVDFYSQLSNLDITIKAEALRRSQIAMLKGYISINKGKLYTSTMPKGVNLPKELADVENQNLLHPFYWAGFTLIGSPW
jgi:filamentous hemagglutinin family protein